MFLRIVIIEKSLISGVIDQWYILFMWEETHLATSTQAK